MTKTSLEVLDMIIEDCETDAKEFDGKPFNGKTLGELHGILEAKIQALAKIIKKEIESKNAGDKKTLTTLRSYSEES